MRKVGIDLVAEVGEAHLLEELGGELGPGERDHGVGVAVALENGRGQEAVDRLELGREAMMQRQPRAQRQHAAQTQRARESRVQRGGAALREAADYDALARYAVLHLLLHQVEHFTKKNSTHFIFNYL